MGGKGSKGTGQLFLATFSWKTFVYLTLLVLHDAARGFVSCLDLGFCPRPPLPLPLPPLSCTDCSRELRVCRLPFVQMICCISVT